MLSLSLGVSGLSGLLLLLLFVRLFVNVHSDCETDCIPANNGSDCCGYGDELIEFCEDELGVDTYVSNCDSSDDNNSTNITADNFDCSLNWDVDFVGKSGQFKLYPCDDSNFFIKVKLESIQEYDENGSKSQNKVTSFSYASAVSGDYSSGNSSVYSWKDADGNDITLGGVTLNYYFYIKNSGALVTFLMNLYLIDDITIIEYVNGNDTYSETLSQATLKFDFTIENWIFESQDSTIEIDLKLTTGGSVSDPDDDGESNDGSTSFSWGDDFVLNMPETYEHTDHNGTQSGRDVDIIFDVNPSGKQTDVVFAFQNAGDAKKIVYDPSMTGETDGSNDSHASKIIITTNVLIFVIACLIWLN